MLIREKLPNMNTFVQYKKDYKFEKKKASTLTTILASPKITKLSPSMKVLSNSPYMKSVVGKTGVAPATLFKKYLPTTSNVKGNKIPDASEVLPDEFAPPDIIIPVMEANPSNINPKKDDDIIMEDVKRLPNAAILESAKPADLLTAKKVDIMMSPSTFLEKRTPSSSMAICSCGKMCEIGKIQCATCLAASIGRENSGYLYLEQDNKLKRYWYKMMNKCLFMYDNIDDPTHKSMVALQGTVIKEELEEIIDSKTILHPFSLFSGNKGKTYYALKKEEKIKWLKAIREDIGCYNFTDYYDMKDILGKGKFGLVRMAIHKGTKKSVAIKIMKKKDMNAQDIELVRREIEILKICQHPNIIRLLDIFENSDYIFIVMEHLKGGDLFSYLEKRKFHISEERAASIVYSIVVALSYLHSYGIAHRDLKPENILLITDQQDSDIKIMDFGLSKIIAPDEKSTEPFGTLSYVAPEVLKMKPYGKSVDLWSMGVIAYLLLSGVLPFDDDKDSEIARMIMSSEPGYAFGKWKNVSSEAIAFSQRLLTKDKDKRMGLDEALKHSWLSKHMAFIKDVRKKSANDEMFKPILPS